jgi:tripartite-type tricarboxylate transporter receptor subunit TctC
VKFAELRGRANAALSGVMLVAAAAFLPVFAAEAYPTKPIRLIVPFPPGGGSDLFGRMIASGLADQLGQQVVVDNRGGAGGIVGTELASKAPPDGHTVVLIAGSFTIYPSLVKLRFDPVKSFTPIARLATGPNALVVHPSVPARSVKELIALAQRRPGDLMFGTSGIAGTPHMATELFRLMSGIDVLIVHYKGGGPSLVDLIGGHIHAVIGSLIQAMPHAKAERVRILGISGQRRSAILPHVPTIAESGLPGYEPIVWFGLLAPAGTPAYAINRLNGELKAILATDEMAKRLLLEGVEPDYMDPSEFSAFMAREMRNWGEVVRKANIKIE